MSVGRAGVAGCGTMGDREAVTYCVRRGDGEGAAVRNHGDMRAGRDGRTERANS